MIAGADVALRKESVDRNPGVKLSSVITDQVALRKESVDRNNALGGGKMPGAVALRKESVDRNRCNNQFQLFGCGRSPQGERG